MTNDEWQPQDADSVLPTDNTRFDPVRPFDTANWSLVIGHWSFVIRHSSLTAEFRWPRVSFALASAVVMARVDRFYYERELWNQGHAWVAGIDEVGRGPLAGPVVVAAVILPIRWLVDGLPRKLRGLNDSKQLTPKQREGFYDVLCQMTDVTYSLAQLDAGEVDRLNILRATHAAMNSALAGLRPVPEHVLVDGLIVRSLKFPQTPLVQGDSRSFSIAAASVIAKVTRDRLMVEYHRIWPQYGFASHKGYSTPEHLEALAEHGPCPIHRQSFSPVRLTQFDLFEAD
jgi:ribonuclease HII